MSAFKHYSERILQIILSLLFFIIPLSYAWWYIPFIPLTLMDILPFLSGFEKVKILFFIAIITLATIAFLGTGKWKKKHTVWLGIFVLWTLISYFVNAEINPYFWMWNNEKAHGWFMYLWLLMLTIILSSRKREDQRKYLNISVISVIIVCLYALFQKIGIDPLQNLYSSRLDSDRIFGTLGNPNYLAGYILMLLPLVHTIPEKKKTLQWIVLWIFILTLFLTKSLFGIWVFIWYILYLFLYRNTQLSREARSLILYLSLGIIVCVIIYVLKDYWSKIIEIQKIKGFVARYFLWETGIHAIFWDIRNTLFGYGPDGFLPVSELFRSPELSVFEDPAFRIDRSHNVWIDTILHFGIPLGGFIIYTIFSQWRKLSLDQREVLVLFSIFFFFNIPVLVHFILLIQILTLHSNEAKTLTRVISKIKDSLEKVKKAL